MTSLRTAVTVGGIAGAGAGGVARKRRLPVEEVELDPAAGDRGGQLYAAL